MKKQVVVIHGGHTFRTYEEYFTFLKAFTVENLDYFTKKGWKDSLGKELGEEFQVIAPIMPNKWFARYTEWSVWFEKLIPFLNEEVLLIGHSMGGTFLTKYLSENTFPKKIKAVFLVASRFSAEDWSFLGDSVLPDNLQSLEKQAETLFVYHSEDDAVVPFSEFQKYKQKLPTAHAVAFKNKGHFNQETFPEIIEAIKGLYKN